MGELAALAAAVTWAGSSTAFARFAGRTAPAVISALRLGSASLVLPLVLLVSGEAGDVADASWESLFWIVLSGALAYAIGDTIYIRALGVIGMQRSFPVTMALFIGLTVAGGVVLLDEDFTWGLPVGAALIAAGISLIVVPQAEDGIPEPAPGEGDLVVADPPGPSGRVGASAYAILIVVSIFWAAASLLLAGKRGDMGPLAAGTIRLPAGALGLLAFTVALQPKAFAEPFRDRRHLAAIILVGLIGTGVGSMLYVYSVLEAGAGRAAVLSATAPLMGLPLSIFVLRERPSLPIVAGTILCVTGIILVVS